MHIKQRKDVRGKDMHACAHSRLHSRTCVRACVRALLTCGGSPALTRRHRQHRAQAEPQHAADPASTPVCSRSQRRGPRRCCPRAHSSAAGAARGGRQRKGQRRAQGRRAVPTSRGAWGRRQHGGAAHRQQRPARCPLRRHENGGRPSRPVVTALAVSNGSSAQLSMVGPKPNLVKARE
jgi:hypothetical protein